MAELPHIGKHCFVESCKQLDFLPFDCDGCGNTFCLQHKGKDGHQCDKHLLSAASAEYTGPKGFSCSVKDCSQRELTPIACEHCHLSFCLSHRHQQDHQCSELKSAPVPNAQTAQHVADILANKPAPAAKKPLKSLKSRQTAARVALMKLKGKAAGDKGLPDTERIYFTVALPLASNLPPKALFFSKKWTVGRVIDSIADSAGLHNPNNTGAAMKLRLFAGDSGDQLAVERSMEEVMDDATGVFSGSCLLLESVDPDLTCLPQLENFKVKVLDSAVGPLQIKTVNTLVSLAMKFFIPKINEQWSHGFPLPVTDDVKFVNTHLQIQQNALMIGTDLQYDFHPHL
ncbi:hypothetical protein ACOMHN_040780 [Nucella lapillus]